MCRCKICYTPYLCENLVRIQFILVKILIFAAKSCKIRMTFSTRMEVKVWNGYVKNMISVKVKRL